MRAKLLAFLLCGLSLKALCAEAKMFPFVISYDAPKNATDISSWLERPAGKDGFVRVADGHLATDAGRVRFWATNLCFEGCFPSHEQAERLAARLARFGINCVRFHHMDAYSIWGDSPNKTIIDPKKLERLDYLIWQLKRHGIYVNLNLHVSRWFDEKEGFPHRDRRPHYDKGLDNFEPRMIELQKKYARDLLSHVNPYTKTPYTDEPAVAFVEISNEDALFAIWPRNQLDNLPDPYATTYRKLWNAWLRKKYGTTERLKAAWKVGEEPLGAEMLTNGDFTRPLGPPWHLERDDQCKASWSIERGGPGGKPFLRVRVERMGRENWIPQFAQPDLRFKKGQVYTLTFRARASSERKMQVNAMMAHEPWRQLGFYTSVELTTDWRSYTLAFVPNADEPNGRITFTGLAPGTYDLAGVSLRPGGLFGLRPGQSLEDDSVPVVRHGRLEVTEQARADFVDFLWDAERDYWWGMCRFLKKDLGLKALVAGTQLSYSPAHIQAGLDYIDAHSYWQHPAFPGRPWDRRNWFVRDLALVNRPPGTLGGLAARRVRGKPFTVSEYNHPAPNRYAAEGLPMLGAFGAFQDWDALYSFTYSHNTDYEPRRITGFFDIKSDPAKLAHQIACAAMFLRGDVAAARQFFFAPADRQAERRELRKALSAWTVRADTFGVPQSLSLLHGIGLDLRGGQRPETPKVKGKRAFTAETGQITWDATQSGAGYFVVNAPRVKVFTGFVRGRTFDLGGITLAIGKTALDWATVSMTCLDGQGFDRPGRILIAATGLVRNTGAEVQNLGGSRITLRDQWGSEPVLCEGVPAQITLPVPPERLSLYALDPRGDRKAEIRVANRDGKALLSIGPEHKTIWYEAVIR